MIRYPLRIAIARAFVRRKQLRPHFRQRIITTRAFLKSEDRIRPRMHSRRDKSETPRLTIRDNVDPYGISSERRRKRERRRARERREETETVFLRSTRIATGEREERESLVARIIRVLYCSER